jgi:nucleoside-diphosphate-sugar epimerase
MRALVFGAGGFIGNHMVTRLKAEGYWVRGVDLKSPDYNVSLADEFLVLDLRRFENVQTSLVLSPGKMFDEIYQFAADMGGAGYIFTGVHDADIMHNSAVINLNLLDVLKTLTKQNSTPKVFYSSSACIYPGEIQMDTRSVGLAEESAYPANPDSDYGWEKLFSERLYEAYRRNYGVEIAIARFHNIYGPLGTWQGGKEKAPAAICRKIAELPASGGEIEVWGDGFQTRSFLYIDDCLEAVRRLMKSDYSKPINIGSEEMVSINELVGLTSAISGKTVETFHKLDAPVGVRGRNSSNDLIRSVLQWDYAVSLEEGLRMTYSWIEHQVQSAKSQT